MRRKTLHELSSIEPTEMRGPQHEDIEFRYNLTMIGMMRLDSVTVEQHQEVEISA